MEIDKRKSKRVPYEVNVLIGNKIMVRGIDLSENGVFLHTGRSFKTGSIVEFIMPMRGQWLTVKARVKHNHESIGMGLKFINLDIVQKDMIRKYISHHPESKKKTGKSGGKVLLIDGNEQSRRIVKSRLILDGLFVSDCAHTRDALILMKTQIPDVIILDLDNMETNAVKALTFLRNASTGLDIPVIICSSTAQSTLIDKLINMGSKECLVKASTSPAKLSATVMKSLA